MNITDMQDEVSVALNQLRRCFVSQMQLTFIARLPGNDDADVLISNDDLFEIHKLVERMKKRKAGVLT